MVRNNITCISIKHKQCYLVYPWKHGIPYTDTHENTCMHTFGSTVHNNHYIHMYIRIEYDNHPVIYYTIIQALTVAWLTTTTYIPRASSPPVTWRA